jgi:RimJ/RimL family protein N-acetyltransferase
MFGTLLVAGTTSRGAEITLRTPEVKKLGEIVLWLNDETVMKLLNPTWKPTRIQEEASRFQAQEVAPDQIVWHVYADELCIGAVWINEIHPKVLSGHYGIMLGNTAFWGQGIATMVKVAVLDWAFGVGKFLRIDVEVFEGNLASQRTSEKLGFCMEPAEIKWDEQVFRGLKGAMTKALWEVVRGQKRADVIVRVAEPCDAYAMGRVFELSHMHAYPNPSLGITRADVIAMGMRSEDAVEKRRHSLGQSDGATVRLVAEVEGCVVGLCSFQPLPDFGYLRALYVMPAVSCLVGVSSLGIFRRGVETHFAYIVLANCLKFVTAHLPHSTHWCLHWRQSSLLSSTNWRLKGFVLKSRWCRCQSPELALR